MALSAEAIANVTRKENVKRVVRLMLDLIPIWR
jgi:hypothetical protein